MAGELAACSDAIIAKLESDVPDVDVQPAYGSMADILRRLIGPKDALCVLYGGSQWGSPSGKSPSIINQPWQQSWTVLVNARTFQSRHKADRSAYGLLEQVRKSLAGFLLPDGGCLILQDESYLHVGSGSVVYGITFGVADKWHRVNRS